MPKRHCSTRLVRASGFAPAAVGAFDTLTRAAEDGWSGSAESRKEGAVNLYSNVNMQFDTER